MWFSLYLSSLGFALLFFYKLLIFYQLGNFCLFLIWYCTCFNAILPIWLLHLSPHWSPGLIQLIWLARQVSPSSLTAPCTFFPKLRARSKRTTIPDRGGPVFGQGYTSSCAPLLEPPNKLSTGKFLFFLSHVLVSYFPRIPNTCNLNSLIFISKVIETIILFPFFLSLCLSSDNFYGLVLKFTHPFFYSVKSALISSNRIFIMHILFF